MIGKQVTVRGDKYVITDMSENLGHLGAKFFGKHRFTLRRLGDGEMFTAYGKQVAHNSRLTPVNPAPDQDES